MEEARAAENVFREILDAYFRKGCVRTVIDDTRFSRISAALIVIDSESCVMSFVERDEVITDTAETDPVLRVHTDIICRKYGDNAGALSEKGDACRNVEFCAADSLYKCFSICKTAVTGGREAEKDFSESQHIKVFVVCNYVFHNSVLLKSAILCGCRLMRAKRIRRKLREIGHASG